MEPSRSLSLASPWESTWPPYPIFYLNVPRLSNGSVCKQLYINWYSMYLVCMLVQKQFQVLNKYYLYLQRTGKILLVIGKMTKMPPFVMCVASLWDQHFNASCFGSGHFWFYGFNVLILHLLFSVSSLKQKENHVCGIQEIFSGLGFLFPRLLFGRCVIRSFNDSFPSFPNPFLTPKFLKLLLGNCVFVHFNIQIVPED